MHFLVVSPGLLLHFHVVSPGPLLLWHQIYQHFPLSSHPITRYSSFNNKSSDSFLNLNNFDLYDFWISNVTAIDNAFGLDCDDSLNHRIPPRRVVWVNHSNAHGSGGGWECSFVCVSTNVNLTFKVQLLRQRE